MKDLPYENVKTVHKAFTQGSSQQSSAKISHPQTLFHRHTYRMGADLTHECSTHVVDINRLQVFKKPRDKRARLPLTDIEQVTNRVDELRKEWTNMKNGRRGQLNPEGLTSESW
ncbi:hypothetical protein CEXT_424911 [Caerostris extrusa]|uniref:Uncharacterized protein n=1 Tax=Caerostris extrusa TaxID=172846 RepID=A0AAV4SQ37_CAEEX|nr:hypothetical protein CEXT_424911 [Caerostris extrusa]